MSPCILCGHSKTALYHKNFTYTYLHCPSCDLVFVKPAERLGSRDEKMRYDQHENDPDDPRYREFLNLLFEPMNAELESQSFGLDYGAGPGPALSLMFKEAGHQMDIYDPFYADNSSVFNKVYDFITTTETAEHFYNPQREFEKLWKLLKPGGYLGIMTLLRPRKNSFAGWHYIRDDTHVSLYSKRTFRWLADKLNAGLVFYGNRTIILKK